jgi:ABC-2 type transport system permease protein
VLLFIAVVVGIGFGVLSVAVIPTNRAELVDTVNARTALVLAGMGTASILLAVLGVLVITQEYRTGTIRVSFAAEPRRVVVVVAKAIVVGVTAVVVAIPTVAIVSVLGILILHLRNLPLDLGASGVVRALIGSVLVAGLSALTGLGIGAIVKHQVLAIVAIVIWALLVEGIVAAAAPSVGKYLPFQAGGALAVPQPAHDRLSPWVGGLELLFVVLVLLAIGALLVRRRDA